MTSPQGAMQTYTGRLVDPLDLKSGDVYIGDIAHALALTNRYGGHTPCPYSVAQHSLYVAHSLPPELKLWGLLHDAAEAYLGDVISPIKHRNPCVKRTEDNALRVIAGHFGLGWPVPVEVTEADLTVGASECWYFGIAVNSGRERPPMATAPHHCAERTWRDAEAQFLSLYEELRQMSD